MLIIEKNSLIIGIANISYDRTIFFDHRLIIVKDISITGIANIVKDRKCFPIIGL